MAPLRIVYVAHFSGGTDASSVMDDALVGALRAQGHDVAVLTPFRSPDVGRVGGSVGVGRLPRLFLAIPGYARVLVAAVRRLRAAGTHILSQYHVYEPGTLVAFLAARLRGRPLVVRAHHLFPGSYRGRAEGIANALLFRVYRRVLRHPRTWFLVSSPEWRDLAVERFRLPGDRVRVLVDNVTPRRAEPDLVRRLRSGHGLEGRRVILKFGSYTRSAPATFADALRRIDRDDVRGVVLADPSWAAAFRREAERRDVADRLLVLETRPLAEVDAFVAIADACVGILSDHPMARGSVPRNTLEAMAAGKPTVLCRGVVTSLLEEDGRNCLTVPPDDPVALAGALRRILGDPRLAAALGARARETVDGRFRSDEVARELAQALAALEGHGSP